MSRVIPRNTLVTVVEIKNKEKKTEHGVVLPTSISNEYREAEIVEVGAGCNSPAAQAESIDDLKSGDRVLVKLNQRSRGPAGGVGFAPIGLAFKDDAGRDLVLLEQTNIVAILESPKPALVSD